MKTKHEILNAYWTQVGTDDKDYHISIGRSGKPVVINDIEFVLVHIIYRLIIRYMKNQGKTITNQNFNKALDEYTQSIHTHVGIMHDLQHRK